MCPQHSLKQLSMFCGLPNPPTNLHRLEKKKKLFSSLIICVPLNMCCPVFMHCMYCNTEKEKNYTIKISNTTYVVVVPGRQSTYANFPQTESFNADRCDNMSDLSEVTLILSSLEEWNRSSFSLKYSSMHCSSKSWTFLSSSSVMKSSAEERVEKIDWQYNNGKSSNPKYI